ncbi:iron-containing alcohol dehydrogenase [Biformimicrobium ophioploci]|uniref:Iron-containing alcohol dehydrogenase n=2 Tax=Biformimicrobium ophioploci TaxID=3036711 RepID=A0ABQ6LXB7_9GAMM|nr:iron-containing alcohol dehydrogenase [Microbulbifer sp. NKW57]
MKWTLQKTLYRTAHAVTKPLLNLVKVPVPELLSGPGSVAQLPELISNNGLQHVLLVTDAGITSLGLANGLLQALEKAGISCTVFDGVKPNPTIENIESGVQVYQSNRCDGIIAFGGGSPMDCAKMIGARVSNPGKSVMKMRGAFKISKSLPPLFAVPTTAGTGSECTIAAVVSDPQAQEKFAVTSLKIVPPYAVLDPELMLGLPPHITASTGMDALTHAIEAYIGGFGTSFTDDYAEKAVKIILEDLETVYLDGSDLERRNNLAQASYFAGLAFTRALIGYVHAIAHNLGGMYGVPHGLANAIVLPHILDFSRADCEHKLARLAVIGGLGDTSEPTADLSMRFIEKIRDMNRNMDIPTTVAPLLEKDISQLAQRALKEGNPDYPVPTLMNQQQCEVLLRKLLPSVENTAG